MVLHARFRLVPVILGLMLFVAFAARCDNHSSSSAPVTLHVNGNRTDGNAVYLLLDVSGSMDDPVPNAQGVGEQKLAIAKRSAIAVCESVTKYAGEKKDQPTRLAIADFSDTTTTLVPMGPPDLIADTMAINAMHANGSTAIGDAVIQAQQALDAAGLRGQHILIITDGENTTGHSPESVAAALQSLPAEFRPTVYVVAFDVNAKVFEAVKARGWQIFGAANGKELAQRLDEIVGGHILIER